MGAGQFKDLSEVLGATPKALPIRGKVYEFPARISDTLGAKLSMMSAAARRNPDRATDGDALMAEFFTEGESAELWDAMFGDAESQMVADGVSSEELTHVFKTLMTWHTAGEDVAVSVWEGKRPGEAPAPNRETRRRGTSATAAATRSRGSSSGTSQRKAAPRKAAGRSRGGSSSSTGR